MGEIVVVVMVVASAFGLFVGSIGAEEFLPKRWVVNAVGWFSESRRAEREWARRVDVRAAELIRRGWMRSTALRMAQNEIEDEARRDTENLRRAGVPNP